MQQTTVIEKTKKKESKEYFKSTNTKTVAQAPVVEVPVVEIPAVEVPTPTPTPSIEAEAEAQTSIFVAGSEPAPAPTPAPTKTEATKLDIAEKTALPFQNIRDFIEKKYNDSSITKQATLIIESEENLEPKEVIADMQKPKVSVEAPKDESEIEKHYQSAISDMISTLGMQAEEGNISKIGVSSLTGILEGIESPDSTLPNGQRLGSFSKTFSREYENADTKGIVKGEISVKEISKLPNSGGLSR